MGKKNIKRDLLKLAVTLIAFAALCYGIYYISKGVDRENKYTHPITRPGASW
ncbi:hypothetical protein [Desulfolithobacter sp.]